MSWALRHHVVVRSSRWLMGVLLSCMAVMQPSAGSAQPCATPLAKGATQIKYVRCRPPSEPQCSLTPTPGQPPNPCGDGSEGNPWQSLAVALNQISQNQDVVVTPGPEATPYCVVGGAGRRAVLNDRNNVRISGNGVILIPPPLPSTELGDNALQISGGTRILVEGFKIATNGATRFDKGIVIDRGRNQPNRAVQNITIRNVEVVGSPGSPVTGSSAFVVNPVPEGSANFCFVSTKAEHAADDPGSGNGYNIDVDDMSGGLTNLQFISATAKHNAKDGFAIEHGSPSGVCGARFEGTDASDNGEDGYDVVACPGGKTFLLNVTASGNTGRGIVAPDNGGQESNVQIENAFVTGNSGTGGIAGGFGTKWIISSTVVGNVGSPLIRGNTNLAGTLPGPQLYVFNTIAVSNGASASLQVHELSPPPVCAYNLFSGAYGDYPECTAISTSDPKVTAAGELEDGSPAINQGQNPLAIPILGTTPLAAHTRDHRGTARPAGAGCYDIGAFERPGCAPTATRTRSQTPTRTSTGPPPPSPTATATRPTSTPSHTRTPSVGAPWTPTPAGPCCSGHVGGCSIESCRVCVCQTPHPGWRGSQFCCSRGWSQETCVDLASTDCAAQCACPSYTPGVPTPTPTRTPFPCAGDCNGNGEVTIDEIITMVTVLLGADLSACPNGDHVRDGVITVNEVVLAVILAQSGCPTIPRGQGGALPAPVIVQLGRAAGTDQAALKVPIAIDGGQGRIAAAQVDVLFNSAEIEPILTDGKPLCTVDSRLSGFKAETNLLSGSEDRLRVVILPEDLSELTTIPTFTDGIVATCEFIATGDSGSFLMPENVFVSDDEGWALESIGRPGVIAISSAFLTIRGSKSLIGAGLQQGGLFVEAPEDVAGALDVVVSSWTPSRCLLSTSATELGRTSISLTIPSNGKVTESFLVQAFDPTSEPGDPIGSCVILAKAEGFYKGAAFMSVVLPAFSIVSQRPGTIEPISGLPQTLSIASANLRLFVDVGIPKIDGSALASPQPLRGAAIPLEVEVNRSYPPTTPTPAALMSGDPLTPGHPVVVHVQPGGWISVEEPQLDPLSLGHVTVSATTSAPGWIATDAASGAVEIADLPTPTPGGCDLDL